MLNAFRALLGIWLIVSIAAPALGQDRPADRQSADPDWYDYEQVGRQPTINGRSARDKIRAYENRAGAVFSDQPVTRRRVRPADAPRRGPQRRTTAYRPVSDMLAPGILAQSVDGDSVAARRFYEDALREYRRGMIEQGWPVEDVAAAMVLYLNNHYTIVFGTPMPPGVPYALYEQFQEILLTDEDFLASDDRERQILAESLAILATATYSQYEFAGGRERERIRQQARANLESFAGQSAEEFQEMVYAIRNQLP
ncbi:hypothetical protein J8C06_13295 [Chloracidobacterium validum]|uniref:Uncharacterized protein n=1 Tax=Chloracidobacterium validum TaxID=2821543 RepID=A0ABX8BAY2_9BACT|nr:DUF6683 family protein [Chloracidobacterium validum]QUW04023.1 hypothetical protein J8C06_13295 [Chloracidobacterium validum]